MCAAFAAVAGAAGIDATAAMAAALLLIALTTPAASITFPWTAQQRTPAKACITSAKRGDLVEALGQLEAAREARDPQLCEAWAAVLDGLAAGGSAATLRFFEAMLHDGFGWADLPRATASKLEGRAPPPALSSGYDAVAPTHRTAARARGLKSPKAWRRSTPIMVRRSTPRGAIKRPCS